MAEQNCGSGTQNRYREAWDAYSREFEREVDRLVAVGAYSGLTRDEVGLWLMDRINRLYGLTDEEIAAMPEIAADDGRG